MFFPISSTLIQFFVCQKTAAQFTLTGVVPKKSFPLNSKEAEESKLLEPLGCNLPDGEVVSGMCQPMPTVSDQ